MESQLVVEPIDVANEKHTDDHDVVTATTASRIKSFDIATYTNNDGVSYKDTHKVYTWSKQRSSVLFHFGVRLVPQEGCEGKRLFVCCVPGCGSYKVPIKLSRGSTKEAARHIEDKHQTVSKKPKRFIRIRRNTQRRLPISITQC